MLLVGIWKNVQELEEALNLDELRAIVEASRERERRANKFAAALKGIKIDDEAETAKEKFEEVQRRVTAKLSGRSEAQLELDVFGLDVDNEDE